MVILAEWLGIRRSDSEPAAAARETESVRAIMTALQQMDPDHARYLAALARLLGRVARADLEISEPERRKMQEILETYGGLTAASARLVVDIARHQSELFGGIDDFQVARLFRQMATREQKLQVLHCLFAVAAADGVIAAREDHEIRNIARELGLEHRDYIEVRLQFRDALGVFRRRTDPEKE